MKVLLVFGDGSLGIPILSAIQGQRHSVFWVRGVHPQQCRSGGQWNQGISAGTEESVAGTDETIYGDIFI
ncbi:MAG: hypothetical protein K2X93_25895 [Candidatus Obscuribacterales bacterium]|nr:hypothetical protein [Candidatus Obscuribacterales bacterium]